MSMLEEESMRLCFLADAQSIHTKRWVSYFADRGHEVHLISTESIKVDEIKNVKIHVLKGLRRIKVVSFLINFLPSIIQVRRLIKKTKPDIVHAHYVSTYGLLGVLTGFHPIIITPWGSDILVVSKKSKILELVTGIILRKANLITCDGENTKAVMISGLLGLEPM